MNEVEEEVKQQYAQQKKQLKLFLGIRFEKFRQKKYSIYYLYRV